MNGISFVISKPCSPMYNLRTTNNINLVTRNNINVTPHRSPSSNLQHLQRISTSVTTPHVLKLKHRVHANSGTVDPTTGSKSEVPPQVTASSVLPYVVLGIIGISITLAKTMGGVEGVLKSKACYSIFLGVAVFVATGFLRKLWYGFALLRFNPFSVGETIEVGILKGQVMETGFITTTLVTAENRREVVPTYCLYGQVIKNISREITIIPNFMLCGLSVVNLTRAPYHGESFKIRVQVDVSGQILEITEEITKMMKSNSNVYLEEEQPYCYLSGLEPDYMEISLRCNLKQMSKEELNLAKHDLLLHSVHIIRKHGCKLGLEQVASESN